MRKCVILGCVLASVSVWAGRPLTVDDADPVEPGHCELEAGVCHERTPECRHWDYPVGLTAGLVAGLEAGVGFGGQFEERTERSDENGPDRCDRVDGVGDLVLGAKWLAIKECPLGARHALAPSVKFPTADENDDLGSGETDYDLTWIASRPMGENAGLHLNVGCSWIGGNDGDVLHYGIAMDYQIVEAVQWVGEVFAERELMGDADTVSQFNTGFRWSPVDGLILDMAAGAGMSGDAPDVMMTAGLTWAFGMKQ